ncbi:MAG: RNA polymerase sigma factor, partial [Acidimicrobiales bacterium]
MSGTAGGAAGPASGAQDAGLVAAAQRGDADAFSELFRRYFASVHTACARRLGDRAEGEELAQ